MDNPASTVADSVSADTSVSHELTSGSHNFVGKLPQLQNLIKRDPDAYYDEFQMQFRHFQSELQIFQLQPTKSSEHFSSLINFLAHVTPCYPKDLAQFPHELNELLLQHHLVLESALRKVIVQSLILLRNRNVVQAIFLLPLFFELFQCPDKRVKELVNSHIISDISDLTKSKSSGRKSRRQSKSSSTNVAKTNGTKQDEIRAVQTFLFSMVENDNEVFSKKSIQILIELYRRSVWRDERTVNVIALGCLSKKLRIRLTSIQFFLGIDKDIMDDDEEAQTEEKTPDTVNFHQHSKKTRKRYRQTRQTLLKNKRIRTKESSKNQPLFSAIHLLNNPQGLAESLFRFLKSGNGTSTNEKFEVKLLMMNFISRLIGEHKLLLLNFYPFVQRYLNSHQTSVTQILSYLIQACHGDIPPEEIVPVLLTIGNNFVTERSSSEVVCVGLNSFREVVARVPLVLEEDDRIKSLTEDILLYVRSKEKGIIMAARSVLNLIREIHPSYLKRKMRGKEHCQSSAKLAAFGENIAKDSVDGTELLKQAEEEGRFSKKSNAEGEEVDGLSEEDEEDGWAVASDDSDAESESGWTNVEEEEDVVENDLSAEEMDEPKQKKKKKSSRRKRKSRGDEESEEESEEEIAPDSEEKLNVADRLESQRILTPLDFQRIAELKKENAMKKLTHHDKVAAVAIAGISQNDSVALDASELESYSKRKRQTQEERLLSVLKGRADFQHKQKGGGTTNKEKKRTKHYLMLRKSRNVQEKTRKSTREVQHIKNKQVKKILKHDSKKRRRM